MAKNAKVLENNVLSVESLISFFESGKNFDVLLEQYPTEDALKDEDLFEDFTDSIYEEHSENCDRLFDFIVAEKQRVKAKKFEENKELKKAVRNSSGLKKGLPATYVMKLILDSGVDGLNVFKAFETMCDAFGLPSAEENNRERGRKWITIDANFNGTEFQTVTAEDGSKTIKTRVQKFENKKDFSNGKTVFTYLGREAITLTNCDAVSVVKNGNILAIKGRRNRAEVQTFLDGYHFDDFKVGTTEVISE